MPNIVHRRSVAANKQQPTAPLAVVSLTARRAISHDADDDRISGSISWNRGPCCTFPVQGFALPSTELIDEFLTSASVLLL